MAGKRGGNQRGTIVIRREEVTQGGHHGGAWKVAYADFVTAMMAFFLLMWLLSATTEKQRRGLADYFAQTNAMARTSSGSGQPLGGHTPFEDGAMVSDRGMQEVLDGRAPDTDPADSDSDRAATAPPRRPSEDAEATRPGTQLNLGHGGGGGLAATPSVAPVQASYLGQAASGSVQTAADPRATDPALLAQAVLGRELARREQETLEKAAQALREAVAADPQLAALVAQLRIEVTPEGLRIQVLDQDRQPMFASGASGLDDRARDILRKVAVVLRPLHEPIAISGHTDAAPFRSLDRSNWELSSERANATRRVLAEAGIEESRFDSVAGQADRVPLIPQNPLDAANRRISILLLRQPRQASPPIAPPLAADAVAH